MSRITAWQSSDQRVFTDRAQFRAHQAWLDLRNALRAGVSTVITCTDPTERDAALALWLLQNRDTLAPLLRHAERAP